MPLTSTSPLATSPFSLHISITVNDSETSALDHLYQYTLTSDNPEVQLTKKQLKDFALKGAIWLTAFHPKFVKKTERLRRLKKTLKPGDILDFYFNPNILNTQVTPPTLVADYQDYSVWIKPRGMLSQGSKWGDHTALYRWVEMHYKPNNQPRQSWIVHRLDRATQGLMLLAHTKKMAQALSNMFEQGQIHKLYQANVWRQFNPEQPHRPRTIAHNIDGKRAISHTTLLQFDLERDLSHVQIEIETGRKHQIRRHLSESGFPIIGDRLYGEAHLDAFFNPRPDLQLTAFQLQFICPINQSKQCFTLSHDQIDLISLP